MKIYSQNEVGGVYRKQIPVYHDEDLMAVIGGVVGLFGIFTFMAALAVLPWGVL